MRLCKINLAIVRYVTYVDIYINIWIKPYYLFLINHRCCNNRINFRQIKTAFCKMCEISTCVALFLFLKTENQKDTHGTLFWCNAGGLIWCVWQRSVLQCLKLQVGNGHPFCFNTYYNVNGNFLAGNITRLHFFLYSPFVHSSSECTNCKYRYQQIGHGHKMLTSPPFL